MQTRLLLTLFLKVYFNLESFSHKLHKTQRTYDKFDLFRPHGHTDHISFHGVAAFFVSLVSNYVSGRQLRFFVNLLVS